MTTSVSETRAAPNEATALLAVPVSFPRGPSSLQSLPVLRNDDQATIVVVSSDSYFHDSCNYSIEDEWNVWHKRRRSKSQSLASCGCCLLLFLNLLLLGTWILLVQNHHRHRSRSSSVCECQGDGTRETGDDAVSPSELILLWETWKAKVQTTARSLHPLHPSLGSAFLGSRNDTTLSSTRCDNSTHCHHDNSTRPSCFSAPEWFSIAWIATCDEADELWKRIVATTTANIGGNNKTVPDVNNDDEERQWFNETLHRIHSWTNLSIPSTPDDTHDWLEFHSKEWNATLHTYHAFEQHAKAELWSRIASSMIVRNGADFDQSMLDESILMVYWKELYDDWRKEARQCSATETNDTKPCNQEKDDYSILQDGDSSRRRLKSTASPLILPASVLYFNTSHAYTYIYQQNDHTTAQDDFFALIQGGWDAQINQGYCGVASSAAVLNSLSSLDLPTDPSYAPYPYATQIDLLNNTCVNERVTRFNDTVDGVFEAPGGLSLSQVGALLECHGVDARVVYMHNLTVDKFRKDLRQALADPNQRVVINFHRPSANQEGSGHFSPLAAYSSELDSFLVLDVAKYKYPPFWIPTRRLYQSLSVEDLCGIWDFPSAQDNLRTVNLSQPLDMNTYYEALKTLGCQAATRGYVVASTRNSTTE